MAIKEVLVPDIGNFDSVDVIDVLVKPGDTVVKDDSLITLESDKASMDIPAPFGGTVKEIKIKVGDKVAQGTLILTVGATGEDAKPAAKAVPSSGQPTPPPAAKAALVAEAQAPVTASVPKPTRPAPEPPKKIQ